MLGLLFGGATALGLPTLLYGTPYPYPIHKPGKLFGSPCWILVELYFGLSLVSYR